MTDVLTLPPDPRDEDRWDDEEDEGAEDELMHKVLRVSGDPDDPRLSIHADPPEPLD